MRKTLVTTVLTLVLCQVTTAGVMPTPGSPVPPPPAAASATPEPAEDAETEEEAQNPLTQIALGLLAVLPSLL